MNLKSNKWHFQTPINSWWNLLAVQQPVVDITVGQCTLCTASTGHWFILPLTKSRVSQLPTHHCCISTVPTKVTDCSPQAFNTDFHSPFSSTTPQLNSTISAFISSCWKKMLESLLTHYIKVQINSTFASHSSIFTMITVVAINTDSKTGAV